MSSSGRKIVYDPNPRDVLGKPYYLGAVFGGDPRPLDRWFLLAEWERFKRRSRRG